MKVKEKDKLIRYLSELRYKKGWSKTSLVNYLKDNYDLKDSRAYELVREAMALTAKAYNEMNQYALSDSVIFLEEMRQKALGEGQTKLALEVSKEINKVSQLYVEKLKLDINVEQPLFTPINKDKNNE